MLKLIRLITFSAMLISFSTSVLALPSPSGDEADPKDNGKREKSDNASSQNPTKKRRANTTTVPNPIIPLPYAPVTPSASLSGSIPFVPAAALPLTLPSSVSEKPEELQPLQMENLNNEDFAKLSEFLDEMIGDVSDISQLNEIGTAVTGINPDYVKPVSTIAPSQMILQQERIPINACHEVQSSVGLPSSLHAPALAVNRVQMIQVTNYDELSGIVKVLKILNINQKIIVDEILLSKKLQQNTEKKAFNDLVFLLKSIEVDQLLQFYICENNFSCKEMIWILDLLRNASRLQILGFKNCNLGEVGVSFLAEHVLPNFKKLRRIKISGSKAGPIAMLKFIQALVKSTSLCNIEMLSLDDSNAGEAALIEFANVLPMMTKLTHLFIGSNNAGPNAMHEFIQALAKSPALSNINELSLSDNKAGEDAMLMLAYLIPKMSSLNKIYISKNNCSSASLKIAEALSLSQKITHVYFASNNLTPEMMKCILVSLSHSRSLQLIALTNYSESLLYIKLKEFLSGSYPNMVNKLFFLE